MDETGSGSCLTAAFVIKHVERTGSTAKQVVVSFMKANI